MLEIKNNLELARHIEAYAPENRQAEYQRLLPELKFKVKSFGYLMKKYANWKEHHAAGTDSEN